MSDRAPYSRIYWSLVDDPKFEGVYDVDAHFATWVRLLMAADAVWPASANLPVAAKARSVAVLCTAGLVELKPGRRFRVKGLDAERRRRGGKPAPDGTQTGPKSAPSGNTDETRRDETSTRQAEQAIDPAVAYWELTSKYPAGKALDWIDDLTAKYGAEATVRALAQASPGPQPTLLGRAQDILRAEARELDRREREDEQRRLKEKRAVPREPEPWQAAYRAALVERYGEDAA